MFKEYRDRNLKQTKKDIAKSIGIDVQVIQSISTIEELSKILNMMIKRLREWFSYYYPEQERKEKEVLIDNIAAKKLKKDDMGTELPDDEIIKLARSINEVKKRKEGLEDYLEKILHKYCPNMQAVIGSQITAKLIADAGSLKRLMLLPSSTIQLLGAEKALFRHLKNKRAKCPKFGLIFQHELISGSKNKGKMARLVASKLSIASRIDYFKGKFIGDKLRKEIEKV